VGDSKHTFTQSNDLLDHEWPVYTDAGDDLRVVCSILSCRAGLKGVQSVPLPVLYEFQILNKFQLLLSFGKFDLVLVSV
jgi:hypothetical protein